MNNSENKTSTNNTITKATFKNGITLGLFALVSTGLIAITHLMTKDTINQQLEIAMAKQLKQIFSTSEYDNDVYHDCTELSDQELLGGIHLKAFRMRNKNKDYAVFINSIAPDGYSGKIKIVVGIYSDDSIAGVRVTEHHETPGLGDKIEITRSNWIEQFNGKSLQNTLPSQWKVNKDGGEFDALTGATITPRAIVKAVKNTLHYYQKNKSFIYSQTIACQNKS